MPNVDLRSLQCPSGSFACIDHPRVSCSLAWIISNIPERFALSHGCAVVASVCASTTSEFGAACSKYFTKWMVSSA